MNRKVHWGWGALALVLFFGLMASVAHAQSLKAEIPFEFVVGDKRMPVGEYTVKPFTPQAVMIQSKDCNSSAIVLSSAVQAKKFQESGKLVFNRYGDQYFLSQIWTPGTFNGRLVPKSRLEREIATLGSEPRIAALTLKR